MKNFWQDLRLKKQPFFVLAPMDDVTDTVFRRVVASVSPPDVFFTEFTNVEGLLSQGSLRVGRRLEYTEKERPLIAQIWGLGPENFFEATKLLIELGFDGVDINMGCPEKSVTAKGACSALIKNQGLAKEMIQAVKEAAGDRLPVSVKTRIGYSAIQTEEWCGFLLEQDLDALIVHGRTTKEMSKVPAHWDEIGKVVTLRDELKKQTVIIGNGDVKSLSDGKEKAAQTGVDGVMVGRGIFENIWFFNENYHVENVSISERFTVLLQHVDLYEKQAGEKLAFQTLKKYFKIYVRDFDGASDIRAKLMESQTLEEARLIASQYVT